MKDMFLLLGTIKDAAAAISFIEAGCEPSSHRARTQCGGIADENNLTWIPGCMTPTGSSLPNRWSEAGKIISGTSLGPWLYGRDQDLSRSVSCRLQAG